MRPEFNFPLPISYKNLIEKGWSYDQADQPTFDEIVNDLKSDTGFITDSVIKEDYLDYIEYVDQYQTSDSDNKIVDFNEIVNSKSKTFQLVSTDQSLLNSNSNFTFKTQKEKENKNEESSNNYSGDTNDLNEKQNILVKIVHFIQKNSEKDKSKLQFEFGEMLFMEAIKCFKISEENGYFKSHEFVSNFCQNLDVLNQEKENL